MPKPITSTVAHKKSTFWEVIRTVYLYVVSLTALIILTINIGRVVHLGLQTWLFPIDHGVESTQETEECNRIKNYGTNNVKITPPENFDQCLERAKEIAIRRQRNEHNRTLSSSIAFVIISLPVWALHYRRALKMKKS
ncbi:MAG: hypothetical protein NTZ80_03045 [Patescibacteria group bacterium]|nr:hypothetical protein [Patescibacteria group bacterium]